MLEILKKIIEANPDKSKIVVNGKCLDCGCDVINEITATSGGYGLQGGALFKCSNDEYCAKCPDCYKINPKINGKMVA